MDSRIRTYVLRAGRMTDAQKRALDTLSAKYVIPFEARRLDLKSLFARQEPVILEIGFGMGQATWRIAQARPQYSYLGVEVHAPGVGKLLMSLDEAGLDNVKVIQHDAIEVLESMIPESSLGGIHLFYPDPWPKKRHHKRRIMRKELLELMVSRLEPGAYLYFVTDIEEYARSTLELLQTADRLENAYADFAPRQEWRPETKFGSKAEKAGRGAWELLFTKRP